MLYTLLISCLAVSAFAGSSKKKKKNNNSYNNNNNNNNGYDSDDYSGNKHNGKKCSKLTSCFDQKDCLDVSITATEENPNEYEICLIFDSSLDGCDAYPTVDSVCCNKGSDTFYESTNFDTGSNLCETVPCEGKTTFTIEDGTSCESDQLLYAEFTGGRAICYDGHKCGRKKEEKACAWQVEAPACQDTTTTTTTPSPTTSVPTPQPTTRTPTEPGDTPLPTPDPTTAEPTTTLPPTTDSPTPQPTTPNPTEPCPESCEYEFFEGSGLCEAPCCELLGEDDCVDAFSRAEVFFSRADDAPEIVTPANILEEDAANDARFTASQEDDTADLAVKAGIASVVVFVLVALAIGAFCVHRRKKMKDAVSFDHENNIYEVDPVQEGTNGQTTVTA